MVEPSLHSASSREHAISWWAVCKYNNPLCLSSVTVLNQHVFICFWSVCVFVLVLISSNCRYHLNLEYIMHGNGDGRCRRRCRGRPPGRFATITWQRGTKIETTNGHQVFCCLNVHFNVTPWGWWRKLMLSYTMNRWNFFGFIYLPKQLNLLFSSFSVAWWNSHCKLSLLRTP